MLDQVSIPLLGFLQPVHPDPSPLLCSVQVLPLSHVLQNLANLVIQIGCRLALLSGQSSQPVLQEGGQVAGHILHHLVPDEEDEKDEEYEEDEEGEEDE